MCERVDERFLVVQPMLRDQADVQALVYLPGLTAESGLYPKNEPAWSEVIGPASKVTPDNWIRGMTPSFLRAALRGEGFDVIEERDLDGLFPNPRWTWLSLSVSSGLLSIGRRTLAIADSSRLAVLSEQGEQPNY